MEIGKAVTFTVGLMAIVWSTGIHSASLQNEDRPKSSLILNESFIQSKILERYHPSRNIKNPQVVLKLPGNSGTLTHTTASTLPPSSASTLKNTETTKTTYNEFGFSAAPNSKLHLYAEKLTLGAGYNRYEGSSSTEPSLQASPEESESQEEDYSSLELSEEELKVQQSQYNNKPRLAESHTDNFNSVSSSYHYPNNEGRSVTSDEHYNSSGDYNEEAFISTTASLSAPHNGATPANRRIDAEIPDFNGLNTQPAYSDRFRDTYEAESFGTRADDHNDGYFVKTNPKDTNSASVSPIVDYISQSATPFTIAYQPTSAPHHTESQYNVTEIKYDDEGFYSNSEVLSKPSATVRNKFGPITGRSGDGVVEDDRNPSEYSSAVPPTSADVVTPADNKIDLIDSPLVSALTTLRESVTPIPSKTSATTDATSIPGIPGIDYPIFSEIPPTGFDCQKQRYKGFFADVGTKCQAWHYCDFTDGHSTFLCPNGTLFSQVLLTCDWWFNVDCRQAQQLYVLNERLYRYIKPPKPSFPEDFHGPQVDLWLVEQLQLGLLPKMRKKVVNKIVINN